jgi:hypothetical protein
VLLIYFAVGKVTRGEGENTGVSKENDFFAVMVKVFP